MVIKPFTVNKPKASAGLNHTQTTQLRRAQGVQGRQNGKKRGRKVAKKGTKDEKLAKKRNFLKKIYKNGAQKRKILAAILICVGRHFALRRVCVGRRKPKTGTANYT